MAESSTGPKSGQSSPKGRASPPGVQAPGILPGNYWSSLNTAQADDADDDNADGDADSALGSDAASSTASITSSILHYRTIHGRTYHSERGNAQYWASNDEKQNEALDILHHVKTLILGGKLFLAPIRKEIQKAVDIGTGTGIWAIDFADEFPEVEVIGTDISPIQPGWVPPNLKFEIEDCTSDWTFTPGSIDYVHLSWLVGSITDWGALFARAYDCLRPGGYVESFEADGTITSDDGTVPDVSAMGQWGKLFGEAGRRFGRPFTVVPDGLQRKGMEAAGFVDIQERDFKVPISGWPKDPGLREIGRYQQLSTDQDSEGMTTFAASELGWTREEILVYTAQFRRDTRNLNMHGYYSQKVVWGRKPE